MRGAMAYMRGLRLRAALCIALCLACALAYLALRESVYVSTIEGQTLTWRFLVRGPLAAPDSVAIVAMDDKTLAAFKKWPLPRSAVAETVERLHAAGAAVIGLDLMLVEPEQPSDGIRLSPGDLRLRDALAAAPSPVLALALTFGESESSPAMRQMLADASFRVVRTAPGSGPGAIVGTGALLPIAPLGQVADLAHVNAPTDHDGSLRHLYLAMKVDGLHVPAFSLELARAALRLPHGEMVLTPGRGVALGERFIALGPRLDLPLNYYGPAGTVPTFSLIDVLEGRVPAAAFSGRAVLVGATAVGAGDTFATPFGRAMPGVEALATGAANLIDGTILRGGETTVAWGLAAIFVSGLGAFVLAHVPIPAAAAALVMVGAFAVAAQLAFQHAGIWLNAVFPAISIAANVGLVAFSRIAMERGLRRHVEAQRANLAHYFSPIVADALAEREKPSFEGREQHAAILFLDIAGFTGRSETMSPADTAAFLRSFHARVERAVLAHHGVLEQFTGDGAMVIFGIPRPSGQEAVAALGCAYELLKEIRAWNDDLVKAGQPPLSIRIGAHYGPVVIARLGGRMHWHLTAAGDTVNVASRLEALTRTHGATIAVSDALAAAVRAAGRDDLLAGFVELPFSRIRGREGRLSVWIDARSARG